DPNLGEADAPLIELRTGPGFYTAIPPSRVRRKADPSIIDTLMWARQGAPSPVSADGVGHAVKLIGAASLLARYWPRSGRHHVTLAFSGLMLKLGASPKEIEQMLRGVTAYREPQDGP